MHERTGAEPSPSGTGTTVSRGYLRRRSVSDRVSDQTRRRRLRRPSKHRSNGWIVALSSMVFVVPAFPAAAPAASPAQVQGLAVVPANCTTMYMVVSGDSWFAISKKTGVSMNALYSANGTSASSPLFPGMQLCLPAGATVTTVTGSTTPAVGQLAVDLDAFPVQGPCWFIDSWQAPRGGGRLHEGVDVMAKAGQYVYAVQDGRLSKQTLDRSGSLSGNAWWLTTADGTYFFYAHLSDFAPGLTSGSRVRAGQIIGFVGSTGNSATAHLHFEVHPYGGDAINPYQTVRAAGGCKTGAGYEQPGGWVPET